MPQDLLSHEGDLEPADLEQRDTRRAMLTEGLFAEGRAHGLDQEQVIQLLDFTTVRLYADQQESFSIQDGHLKVERVRNNTNEGIGEWNAGTDIAPPPPRAWL